MPKCPLRNCLLTLAFFFFRQTGYTQIIQSERFEIPVNSNETIDNFTVVSGKEHGLIVVNRIISEQKTFLHIIKLDTTLTEIWSGNIDLEKNMIPRKSAIRNDTLFLLCKSVEKTDLLLMAINLDSKNYKNYAIRNSIPFTLSDFVATKEAVLIGGYFNGRPIVLHYSPGSGNPKMLPGFFNDPGELVQLKVSDSDSVDIIVSEKINGKKCLSLRNFDAAGNLARTITLEPKSDKNLLHANSVRVSDGSQLVAGVYGKSAEYALGIFAAKISTSGDYDINYYNFGDLKNFFNHLTPSQEKRIAGKIKRREKKGREINYNYRISVGEFKNYGDEFLLLAEAYTPFYKSAYNTPFKDGTPATSRFGNVFDGYEYTHAIVAGFSKTGKLLWDNNLEIEGVRSLLLDQKVKIQSKGNQVNLFYFNNNQFYFQSIRGNEVTKARKIEMIQNKSGADTVKPGIKSKNRLEPWYDDHFFALGIQDVSERQKHTAAPKLVFFIEKITSR